MCGIMYKKKNSNRLHELVCQGIKVWKFTFRMMT